MTTASDGTADPSQAAPQPRRVPNLRPKRVANNAAPGPQTRSLRRTMRLFHRLLNSHVARCSLRSDGYEHPVHIGDSRCPVEPGPMTVSLPNPSTRLLRAAVAERADLVRHRERLTGERARLLSELRELDDALSAVDRRLEVLAELAGPPEDDTREMAPVTPTSGSETVAQGAGPGNDARPRGADPGENHMVLRGPAVREAAVRVLIAQPGPIEALHYRRWYELLLEAGFRVAGKDPLAVFLTQLSRSPLVRKTSAPGVYEVDRQAPLRIRQRLDRLQAELREVTVRAPGHTATASPIELGTVRARRHELDVAISQQERALEEALRVLRGEHAEVATAGAAETG